MNIALYSPYLQSTIGGGERYLLTVAQVLLENKHQVTLLYPESRTQLTLNIIKRWENFFDIRLGNLKLRLLPNNPVSKLLLTRHYDYLYAITDGSLFFSSAKHNLLHFQIPLRSHPHSLIWRLKLMTWPQKVAISHFTKQVIEKYWSTKVDYIHGVLVETKKIKPLIKINQILTVGRIFTHGHSKRHDFLIRAYKQFPLAVKKKWHLKIIGHVEPGEANQQYFLKLKQLASQENISFDSPKDFHKLTKIYGQSKIYWHATGADVDEIANPEQVEHLGLTTIEAMSAGCVPVVINKGGQKEIVDHQKNGLLWDTSQQLIQQTLDLIKSPAKTKQFAQAARQKAVQQFNFKQFTKKTLTIFSQDEKK